MENDVLEDILASLPIESALQSKQVCKTWRNLVRKNTKAGILFAFSHVFDGSDIQFYYSEYQQCHREMDFQKLQCVKLSSPVSTFNYSMVGSCNGLVCLGARPGTGRHDPVIIINPVTGKYSHLPIYSSESKEEDYAVVAGFGYVHSNNQYKVVRIYFKRSDKCMPHVLVYTLGSPLGWREIAENVPLLFSYASGVFANGLLHWVDEKDAGSRKGIGKKCNIVSFDLGDECFYPIPSPPLDYSNYTHSELFLLGGNLCLHVWGDKYIEIWSFKKTTSSADNYQGEGQQRCRYENTWSWCKDFGINCDEPLSYQAFAITNSNEVLVWYRERTVYSYDSKTSTFNKLWDTVKGAYIPAIPHMNSLISAEIQENGQMNL